MTNELCTKTQADLASMGAINIRTQSVKTHAGEATVILADVVVGEQTYPNCGFVEYWEDYPQRFALWEADKEYHDGTFSDVARDFDNHVEAEAERANERRYSQ